MKEEKTKKITTSEEKSVKDNSFPTSILKTNKKPMSFWHTFLSLWISRKLFMTLVSFGLIWGAYERTLNHLYTLNNQFQTAAVSSSYVATLSVLGVIIAAYLGTNSLQAKFSATSATQLIGQSLSETKDSTDKSENTETKNINYTEHVDESVPNLNLRADEED